jgi:hypothetical protein
LFHWDKKNKPKRHRKRESVFDLINEIEETGELKNINNNDRHSGKAELAKAIAYARSVTKKKRKKYDILYSGWIRKQTGGNAHYYYKKRYFILYSNRMFE